MEAQQRDALYATKLSALVGAPAEPVRGGAGAVAGGTAWFLAEDLGVRALGPAFAWAEQHGAERLEVIVPAAAAGVVARRAALFREPPLGVGRRGSRARARGRVVPPAPQPIAPEIADLIDLILDAGADPVVEHGVLTGEVAGLEVLRAVVDPHTGEPRLEVGLGNHDREPTSSCSATSRPSSAIASVVESVRAHREVGAPPHALNRIATVAAAPASAHRRTGAGRCGRAHRRCAARSRGRPQRARTCGRDGSTRRRRRARRRVLRRHRPRPRAVRRRRSARDRPRRARWCSSSRSGMCIR